MSQHLHCIAKTSRNLVKIKHG
uniref:Uncharacterized protein n=1 Tax=Anguilla anguilla TaxID=7936 RepID=A0A0E9PG50_ANGAN